MTSNEWYILKAGLVKTVHPSKPVYRKIGWRKGKRLYEFIGFSFGDKFIRLKRTPYIQVQLSYSDPHKQKLARGYNRFWRKTRLSTMWFDHPKGFWRGLLQL